jgi:uncharacterized membrane protein
MVATTCARCGRALDDSCRFCPACGAPVAGAVAEGARHHGADLQPNVAGLLCYLLLLVTGILFLLIEPYNRDHFVRFHAFQSIFFFIFLVIVQFLSAVIVMGMNAAFPPPLDFASHIFLSLVTLGALFLWIFLMYKAYCNETFRLPVIGDLAAKQA